MIPKKVFSGMLITGALLACALLVGCSGDTDGGSAADESYLGTSFVGSDGSTGRIELDVTDTRLDVGAVSGFRVWVFDSNGNPVPQIRISCDTEEGLALVEPTTGSELTDSNGQMSGRVGCEVPGSFQIACRLPIGANWRVFETIHCAGSVTEFGDGSAGGGLGGPGGGVDDGGAGE